MKASRLGGIEFGGESGTEVAIRDVAGLHAPGFGGGETRGGLGRVREADDLMPGGMELIGGALADESTACDEHLHSGRCF
jgi:hypothetical protein